ncbi:MAG: efflux RND transporter periplasmic adaptor subunit [candidate division Zixibacteria bacterium]|nr:efflux RND transporter periplasmic adaptor subunit [candidate division Zixibacteria bacterium]MBU1471654.1 efflux RND transporter periplasmic adaptor subunit [candidate division Zixibacteria bacterium]MBU2626300.1 efflux RND transporter periplasmic adaptor subunit [candidate division Zixibacteria bacterium]
MKKSIYAAIIVVAVLGGYYGVNAFFTISTEIPTALVAKGEFVISQKANGSVDAKRAYTMSAPRIRGLQITWLAPEGAMVKEGDPVIKFDATQQQADLTDNESTLKIARTTLERAQGEYSIQEKQLKLDLKKAQRNYDEMKHEAIKLAEEAKLELELAELNFEAKLEQIKADVEKATLEVQRAQDKVNLARRELDQLTMNAPIPGMVVYLEIWKGGSMSKVQEGDGPWPGQGLIQLPDLSEMVVKAAVSEVNASEIDSGQAAIITLDAFPNVQHQGVVTKKSTLARRKEPGSKINVFDVEIAILENDKQIKPGMSASSKIIMDRIADVVSVPLEAVFEKEGEIVVYLGNKDKRSVEVGRRNDMNIEILSGLDGGERVCLSDPTVEELDLPGDVATEPELNKGRQAGRSINGS